MGSAGVNGCSHTHTRRLAIAHNITSSPPATCSTPNCKKKHARLAHTQRPPPAWVWGEARMRSTADGCTGLRLVPYTVNAWQHKPASVLVPGWPPARQPLHPCATHTPRTATAWPALARTHCWWIAVHHSHLIVLILAPQRCFATPRLATPPYSAPGQAGRRRKEQQAANAH